MTEPDQTATGRLHAPGAAARTLPAWSSVPAQPATDRPTNPGPVQRRSGRRRWPLVILPVLALLVVLGVVLARSNGSKSSAADKSAATRPAGTAVSAAPATTPTTLAALAASTATSTSTSTSTVVQAPPPATTAPRSAVYAGGKIYLRGAVPTQEIADQLVAKVGKVVGPTNVVNQYVIVPGTPAQSASPTQIADTVLFDTDSAVVRPEFAKILDLGVTLMTLNPAVTIDVIGYTDNTGAADFNLTLSQRRIDAVIGYFVAHAIPASRLVAMPRGGINPVADNATAEGRRLNRRIEFVINNLVS